MKRPIANKIHNLQNLIQEIKSNNPSKSIGLCHGVFDVIHSGHIDHFQEASNLVDILVVSVTTDKYVNKGPGRPVNKIGDRTRTLAGVEYIDYVIESEFPSAIEIIKILKPNYYFKGKDYGTNSQKNDIAGNLDEEKRVVVSSGGQLYFTKAELKSSSSIINSLNKISGNQLEVVSHVKEFILENPIQEIINKIKLKKITVIGEIIQDEYIFTESLGKSGKHPLVAERELHRKEFLGGIAPLVETFNTFINRDNIKVISLQNSQIPENKIGDILIDKKYTNIRKTRYINFKTNTFMFEKYQMNDEYVSKENENALLTSLDSASKGCDLLVVLDFGHGLITPDMRKYITSNFDNIALNVQRNAGNKGFSNVGKYQSASLIVMNGEEVELELKQKGVDLENAARIIHSKMNAKILAITDGSAGLVITNGNEVVRVPSFHDGKVVDRTGAGDALFAILSLFNLVIDDLIVLGYLGNLAGAISLNWFANEKSITVDDIIQSVHFGLK